MEDPKAVALALDRHPVFEVCITSNFQSGVVPALGKHPLMPMLAAGLNVTLNTDDPSISKIDLGNEYGVAVEELGMALQALKERVLSAARAAFLPENERQALVQSLEEELNGIVDLPPSEVSS
jgi:adenosine deaminase